MVKFEPRPTNPFPLVRGSTADFPLSAGQERLWWLHQGDASYEYHITGGWRFPDGVDRAALATALTGLVRRHQILRTRFVLRPDGRVAQEVADEIDVPVVWAGSDWRAAVDRAVREPFDLARPPLLRVVVAELDDGYGVLTSMHHIITDRWSMDVLARDLFELYDAALEHREPELPELVVQYGDYADWQRRFLGSGALQPQLDHWVRALRGSERLDLALDRPRSAANDAAAGTVVVELSEEATAAMTAMAWRARATPAVVVTAALTAALSAFSGQTDVVIGAIVSDRPRPELQDLIGFFINTVALRVDLSGEPLTFRSLVTRTRDAWMAADAHQDVPFERIVGALHAGSESRRNPIFDIAVNHAGDRVSLAEAPGAPAWWYPELPVTARFDLSLTTQVVDGRLRATFVYRSALFDEAPISALATSYIRLLEQGVSAPELPLHQVDLVEEPERKRLHGANDATAAPETTIVELVQAQAHSRPSAPAVVGADGALTYQQLNERANRLARHLLTQGAGPERVVAVCLDKTVERFVVLLAIAKAGAAYLPLDPDHPADRLRFLVADAGAVLTVVSPGLHDRLPASSVPTLVFGAGTLDLSGYDAGDLPRAASPDNLAYLISTSGSTGTPKSVAVPHRALSRLVAGVPRHLDVGPGTTFLQCGPLTFDVAVLEWTPLAHGGSVVVTDTGTLLDGLDDVVRAHGVTTLKLVSPQLDLLVERDIRTLAGLSRLVVGGDVVNPRSFAAAREGLPGCRVTASYGPTECTVLATLFDGEEWKAGRIPIGYALPHTRVYLLDRELRPVSVGMRGEIYLAGDGLARGYHGRPGATAAAFVPDPYGPPGARMYRTGDVGRYLPSGAVDFLGRADKQVKIRGFRIELSEIEQVLLREPGITSAVALRVESATGPALAAYVVATDPVDVPTLRARLGATLPAYMLPDHVVEVPRIPLTANNKVDRTALPPVAEVESAPTAPTTGLEARVVEAWSAVLGRTVPATADFFASGGHSLLVPRATAAIRRLLGREVPLRLMMTHRTPAAFAAAILEESAPDLGAATREHRLEQHVWHSPAFPGARRLDLFVSAGQPGPDLRTLIVLDGSEFVDIMRLPALLDRLVLEGRIPATAALFVSPAEWSVRNRELLHEDFVDVLADELIPHLRDWLGERWRGGRTTAVGASLGAVTAVRAALRRPDSFDGAVGMSGPLTDHRLLPSADAGPSPARFFLSASREEAEAMLDGGISQLDATKRTGEDLALRGHSVRCAYGDGGHTYAAWEAMLPEAIGWALGGAPGASEPATGRTT
ncbi:amino acid adenylation domain-containing protein [Streptomyces sp. NPDC001928]|uniref:non-ribosomal peptide synthetase n=1 Tax=Streptomyces sp. NPDC001928 TaxID=3154404 RepID=UPI00332DEDC6